MICTKIQVLQYPSGIPADMFVDGCLFLDPGPDFGIRLTRRAEELNEVNRITVGGALGASVPDTAKNRMILGKYINPNSHNFNYVPLRVIAYSSANVLAYTLLYVLQFDENPGREEAAFEIELRDDQTHWVSLSKKIRLRDIEFDPFTYTKENIEATWAQNPYTVGDTGLAFPWIYRGAWKEANTISVEDLPPFVYIKHLLIKGLALCGFAFKSPIFDLPIGKKLIAYLIDPFTLPKDGEVAKNTFRANITTEVAFASHPDPTYNYKVKFDNELDDPNDVYDPVTGEFTGEGNFDFSFGVFFGVPPDQFSNFQSVCKIRLIKRTGTIRQVLYESNVLDWVDVYTPIRAVLTGSVARVQVGANDAVFVEVDIPGAGETITEGSFLNYNNLLVIKEGTEFRVNELFAEEYTLFDVIKGVAHIFRAKIHADPNTREWWLYPNYDTKWFDDPIDGYYLDTVVSLIEMEQKYSSIVKSQDQLAKRYISLRWKRSQDARIIGLKYPDDRPIFSKFVDLGGSLQDETEILENPFFEPTVNDKVVDIAPLIVDPTSDYHIDLPFFVDNDEGLPSFNIGPRILIFHGDAEYHIGGLPVYARWCNETRETIPYASMFPNMKDASNLALEEFLIYGDRFNDLYSVFWKRWIYDTFVNTKVSALFLLTPNQFFALSFRNLFHIISNGKSVYARMTAANDFDSCGHTTTPIDFLPATGQITAVVEEDESDEAFCAGQNPVLSITLADNVYEATDDVTLVTDTVVSTTIDWRYFDEVSWTVGDTVTDPDRPFYIRLVVETDNCGTYTRIKYYNPCGVAPFVIWRDVHLDPADDSLWCISADIGGSSLDGIIGIVLEGILSSDLESIVDGGAPAAYTIGDEICGIEEEITITGTVTFDDGCGPVAVEATYTFPPVVKNCLDNNPIVECVHIGNDMFTLQVGGSWVSNPQVYFIQFRMPGETDKDWKIWNVDAPVPLAGTFESRVIYFWCDECPPVCSPVVECAGPGLMLGLSEMVEDVNSMSWNWSKLPASQKALVKHLYSQGAAAKIVVIHDRYKLSAGRFCCGEGPNNAMKHVKYAIDNGEI